MILIALGANLPSLAGPPAATLRAALAAMGEAGIKVVRQSHLYASPAWPNPTEPPFVNAVVAVETTLRPETLLEQLHVIEARFGRKRGRPNAPRPLDLDLIDYDGEIRNDPPLVLPHPRLGERAFVLKPLLEVAPNWRDPQSGKAATTLLAAVPSADRVKRLEDIDF